LKKYYTKNKWRFTIIIATLLFPSSKLKRQMIVEEGLTTTK
jgi:hypothetical protein